MYLSFRVMKLEDKISVPVLRAINVQHPNRMNFHNLKIGDKKLKDWALERGTSPQYIFVQIQDLVQFSPSSKGIFNKKRRSEMYLNEQGAIESRLLESEIQYPPEVQGQKEF